MADDIKTLRDEIAMASLMGYRASYRYSSDSAEKLAALGYRHCKMGESWKPEMAATPVEQVGARFKDVLDDALWALACIGNLHTIDNYTDKEAAERAMEMARNAYAKGAEARKALAPAPSAQALREALEDAVAAVEKSNRNGATCLATNNAAIAKGRAALNPSTQQKGGE